MKVSALLVLLLGALLFFSGCTILYTSGQEFGEDGTSVMTIDHQLALPQADFNRIRAMAGAMLPTITDTNYRLLERLLQRSNEAYAKALCADMKDATCTVGPDNKIHIVASLKANSGFYTMTVENDTTNASAPKQIRTYTITKIPIPTYFTAQGKTTDELGRGIAKSVISHFQATLPGDIDSIIKTDYYCFGITPYGCDVVSSSGDTINLRLTGSSAGLFAQPAKLVWMGCTARNSSEVSDMNESQAAKVVSRKMSISDTPDESGLEVSVTCPANSTKTLVVAATPVNPYARNNATVSPTIYTYALVSKEDMKTAVVQGLEQAGKNLSQLSLNNTPIGPLELNELVIDLEKGTFGNTTTFSDMQDSVRQLQTQMKAANISLQIDISYSAKFPGKVTSATGGLGNTIPITDNGFTLTLADLARMGNGKIVVRVEKPLPIPPAESAKIFGLDPVILFGGAILAVLVVAGIVWFLTRKPKEPEHAGTMPPTTYADPHHPQM